MSEKTYSMSQYASMADLLSDKCKDQQERIQRLEAENAELCELLDQYQGCDYIAKLEQHISDLLAEKKELRKLLEGIGE